MLAAPAEEFDPTLRGSSPAPAGEFLPLLEAMGAAVRRDTLRTQLLVMAEADQRDLLSRIAVPTFADLGRARRAVAGSGRAPVRASVPDATLVVIPNFGHVSNLEKPEHFNEAVRHSATPIRRRGT
jgi:pimeloyl-ACP methyl ester carboxylesterase